MGRLIVTASGGVLEVGDAPIRGPLDFFMGPGQHPMTDRELIDRGRTLGDEIERLAKEEEQRMSEPVCRAKFVCNAVTKKVIDHRAGTMGYEADFSAVYAGTEENDKYFRATPYGSLKVATLKADFFEPGKTYYLDFIAAD